MKFVEETSRSPVAPGEETARAALAGRSTFHSRLKNLDPRIAAILAAAVVVSAVLSFALSNFVVDDAYISFRYALNLAQGKGLTYNPGEHVEGYTNFLWVILLAGAHLLGANIPSAAQALGFLAALLTLGVTWLLAKHLFPGRSPLLTSIPVLLLATNRPFWLWAVSGMETNLFSLFLTAGVAALLADREAPDMTRAALLFFAATLTRPEGIAFFLLALAGLFLFAPRQTGWRAPLRALIVFLALLTPYLAWKYWYFGSLLPNTFYAKNIGRSQLFTWGLAYVSKFVADYAAGAGALAILLGFFVAPAGAPRAHLRLIALLALFGVLYPVTAGGDIYYYNRFMVPILPLLFLLVTAVTLRLAEAIGARRPGWSSALTAALIVSFVAATALLLEKRYHAGWVEDRALGREREEIAAWLTKRFPPDTTIATIVAGYVPYATGMPNIDLAGLTNKEVGRSENKDSGETFRLAHEKSNVDYVLRRQPALIEFRVFITPTAGDPASAAGIPLDYGMLSEKFRYYPAHRDLALSEGFQRHYRLMGFPMDKDRIVATFQRFPAGEIPAEEALANLGTAWYAEGSEEIGVSHLLRAARENPRNPLVLRRLGRIFAESPPPVAANWENSLGVILFEAHGYAEAEGSFRDAARLDPANPDYRNNLAFVLIEHRNRPEEGLVLAKALVNEAPRSPLYLDTLALGLFRTGRVREALAAAGEAARLDPANADIQGHLKLFRNTH